LDIQRVLIVVVVADFIFSILSMVIDQDRIIQFEYPSQTGLHYIGHRMSQTS